MGVCQIWWYDVVSNSSAEAATRCLGTMARADSIPESRHSMLAAHALPQLQDESQATRVHNVRDAPNATWHCRGGGGTFSQLPCNSVLQRRVDVVANEASEVTSRSLLQENHKRGTIHCDTMQCIGRGSGSECHTKCTERLTKRIRGR